MRQPSFKRIAIMTAASLIASTGVAIASSTSASALSGDYVDATAYPCGGSHLNVYMFGGVEYHEWNFRNCSNVNVYKKVLAKSGWQGPCYIVPAGRARTLDDVTNSSQANPYDRTLDC